jgi:hypothetical protein
MLNQTKTEWIDNYYSTQAEWIEYPSAAYPNGRKGDVEALRKSAESNNSFFPDRKMKIVNQISEGNQSNIELEWQGTTARKMGNMEAGTLVKLRISSYFVIKNNKIIKHTDYIVPHRE